ncbi:MAG: hypothetical protein J4G17_03075 [Anaerolineae bacterium]|nr:hypothetical protein [Anaerolineae bacterium]
MNDDSTTKENTTRDFLSAMVNVLNNIQGVLGVVLASGALATATGFLVVNSLLLKYDFFVSFAILPAEYISAGLIVWIIIALAVLTNLASLAFLKTFVSLLLIIFNFIDQRLKHRAFTRLSNLLKRSIVLVTADPPKSAAESLASGLPKFLLFLFNTVLWSRIDSYLDDSNLIDSFYLDKFIDTVPTVASILLSLSLVWWIVSLFVGSRMGIAFGLGVNAYSIFLSLATAALLILSLGFDLYLYIPKSWGGGSPIPINVFLEVENEGVYLGMDVDEYGMSENVCLLAEMFDGLFIYNPRTKRSIVLSTGSQSAYIGHAASAERVSCAPPESSAGTREICSLLQAEINSDHAANIDECSQPSSSP